MTEMLHISNGGKNSMCCRLSYQMTEEAVIEMILQQSLAVFEGSHWHLKFAI